MTPLSSTTPATPLPAAKIAEPELDAAGGTVDLPAGAQLVVPSGAFAGRTRVTPQLVPNSHWQGFFRYHPISQPLRLEARQSNTPAAVTHARETATVRGARLRTCGPDAPLSYAGLSLRAGSTSPLTASGLNDLAIENA
ncbi:MAG: hypothetical protein IT307_05685 [Chloroflexi bacterium]|nr:hypothetical protein [Chloroflexota bacterium]